MDQRAIQSRMDFVNRYARELQWRICPIVQVNTEYKDYIQYIVSDMDPEEDHTDIKEPRFLFLREATASHSHHRCPIVAHDMLRDKTFWWS